MRSRSVFFSILTLALLPACASIDEDAVYREHGWLDLPNGLVDLEGVYRNKASSWHYPDDERIGFLWQLVTAQHEEQQIDRDVSHVRIIALDSSRLLFERITPLGRVIGHHQVEGELEDGLFHFERTRVGGLPPILWGIGDFEYRLGRNADGGLLLDYASAAHLMIVLLPASTGHPTTTFDFPREGN